MIQSRSNNFTLMRLLFALLVVYSHSYATLGIDEPEFMGRTTGSFAVQAFFILSGYLVAGSFLTTSPRSYIARRVLRVVPALFIAYSLSMFAASYFDRYPQNAYHEANGPIWTITWEVLLYIILFFVGIMGLLSREIVGACYLTGVILFFAMFDLKAPHAAMVTLFLLFGGGVLIRLTETTINMRFCGLLSIGILAALYIPVTAQVLFLLKAATPFQFGGTLRFDHLRWILSVIGFPYAIIWVARYAPFNLPVKNDYSYGVYLFAWPIQQIIVHFGLVSGPLQMFAMALPLSLLCGALSWHLVERHAIRLGHTRWRDMLPQRPLVATQRPPRTS